MRGAGGFGSSPLAVTGDRDGRGCSGSPVLRVGTSLQGGGGLCLQTACSGLARGGQGAGEGHSHLLGESSNYQVRPHTAHKGTSAVWDDGALQAGPLLPARGAGFRGGWSSNDVITAGDTGRQALPCGRQ